MEYTMNGRGQGEAARVAAEGAAALKALDTARYCAQCSAPKPTEARGWSAGIHRRGCTRTVRVLCATCNGRRRTAAHRGSSSTTMSMTTRRRRLRDAEGQLAALTRAPLNRKRT
jgi:hypothetical protein